MIEPTKTSDLQTVRISELERKVQRLERIVSQKSAATFSSERVTNEPPGLEPDEGPTTDYPDMQKPDVGERMFFKGKGLRTEFYGASNPWSLISHVSCWLRVILNFALYSQSDRADEHSYRQLSGTFSEMCIRVTLH